MYCSAGKPDALRSILKHAETHLSEMVHAAWDLILSTSSKKPSTSLNDVVGAPVRSTAADGDATSKHSPYNLEGECQHHLDAPAGSMDDHAEHHSSNSDGSSSAWYTDRSSSDELSDGSLVDEERAEESGPGGGASHERSSHVTTVQPASEEGHPGEEAAEPGA